MSNEQKVHKAAIKLQKAYELLADVVASGTGPGEMWIIRQARNKAFEGAAILGVDFPGQPVKGEPIKQN